MKDFTQSLRQPPLPPNMSHFLSYFGGSKLDSLCSSEAPPRLLVTGCGRSGTHAVMGMLETAGLPVIHENVSALLAPRTNPYAVFVSWPMLAYVRSRQYWGEKPCFAPVVKIHREPLGAISSLANGFAGRGECGKDTAVAAWEDEFSWQISARVIELPGIRPLPMANRPAWVRTCRGGRRFRIALALAYWVQWNKLGDLLATHTIAVENASAAAVHEMWCAHCAQMRHLARVRTHRGATCVCAPLSKPWVTAVEREGHNASSILVHGEPLSWEEMYTIDGDLAAEAAVLARSYGYSAPLVAPGWAPSRRRLWVEP